MADAGVGVFVWRMNNCGILALVYKGGRRGGTDVFVCLAFKNSLLRGGEGGCFDRCCCRSLCKWHARAVELGSGCVSVDPGACNCDQPIFVMTVKISVLFEGGARKIALSSPAAHIFCPGKANLCCGGISRPCDHFGVGSN